MALGDHGGEWVISLAWLVLGWLVVEQSAPRPLFNVTG